MSKPTITPPPDSASVVAFPVPPKQPAKASEQKWGKQVIAYGHCTVPSLLLHAQFRLGLSAQQFNVVMQLADFWWKAGDPPHPSKETLAFRMGISARQVQRHLTALEKMGVIEREERFRGPKEQTSNAYRLTGLVAKLAGLEPEFRKVREQNKLRKKKVETKVA